MIDRTSKVIFAAIALGLWLNVFAPFLHPARASAEDLFDVVSVLKTIEQEVSSIKSNLQSIELGTCSNKKLC